jgi:hypothetical protein
MPVTVHQLIDGAKDAAQAHVPNLTGDQDLTPVLLFAYGDSWHPWAIPRDLRAPSSERFLLGEVLRAHDATAAVFSFTAWVKPALTLAGADPRETVALAGLAKDEAGEREKVALLGVDRDGLLLHSNARLKRRAMNAPHLGAWEDAPPLTSAVDHIGRWPETPRAIVRALLLGVRAVEAARAA